MSCRTCYCLTVAAGFDWAADNWACDRLGSGGAASVTWCPFAKIYWAVWRAAAEVVGAPSPAWVSGRQSES